MLGINEYQHTKHTSKAVKNTHGYIHVLYHILQANKNEILTLDKVFFSWEIITFEET